MWRICNMKSHSTTSLHLKKIHKVIWVYYRWCLDVHSEENQVIYVKVPWWVLGPPACLRSYIARVWNSTLVRMGVNTNHYDSYMCTALLGVLNGKGRSEIKIFSTCFKISPGLRKKQRYWENRVTAERACERTFWVVAKASTQKAYITWVTESTQQEPSIQPLRHTACLDSK